MSLAELQAFCGNRESVAVNAVMLIDVYDAVLAQTPIGP